MGAAQFVAALDLSSVSTGVAFGSEASDRPHCLTWRMPGASDLARSCGILLESVSGLFAVSPPAIVIIEAPLYIAGRSAHTAKTLMALFGVAMGASHAAGARIIEGNVQTVRRHFVGQSRPDDPKRAVMDRCRQLGWTVRNDDEADAAALWAFAMATNFKKWAPRSTPLFTQAVA